MDCAGDPVDRKKYFQDESASVMGANFCPLWEDPDKTLSIGFGPIMVSSCVLAGEMRGDKFSPKALPRATFVGPIYQNRLQAKQDVRFASLRLRPKESSARCRTRGKMLSQGSPLPPTRSQMALVGIQGRPKLLQFVAGGRRSARGRFCVYVYARTSRLERG